MSGWGTGGWGTGAYGGGGGPLFIVGARAVTTKTVRVTLSQEPKHSSPFDAGDALNATVWAVQRLDTLQIFTILGVSAFDPPYTFDIVLLERLGPYASIHRVSSTTLQALNGATITPPRQADFNGMAWADANFNDLAANNRYATRDLANRPAPDMNVLGGTLQIADGGDYVNVTGPELVRKLIFRRLITIPGDFFHLPEYGIGFAVKEPLPAGDLSKLKAEIERQIRLESEVDQAKVDLSATPDGIVTIQIRARVKPTGQVVAVSMKTQPGVVQL